MVQHVLLVSPSILCAGDLGGQGGESDETQHDFIPLRHKGKQVDSECLFSSYVHMGPRTERLIPDINTAPICANPTEPFTDPL